MYTKILPLGFMLVLTILAAGAVATSQTLWSGASSHGSAVLIEVLPDVVITRLDR